MVSQRTNWEGYGESGLEARGADPPTIFATFLFWILVRKRNT